MPARRTPARPDTPCRELWNLSDTTAAWLAELGVHTHGQLAAADLFALWAQLRQRHAQVTKLMFLAMAGAVHDVHWRLVPGDVVEAFEQWRATPTTTARDRRDQRGSRTASRKRAR